MRTFQPRSNASCPKQLPLLRAVREPVDEDDGALGRLAVRHEPAEALLDDPVPDLLLPDALDLRDRGVVVGHGPRGRAEAAGRGGPERQARRARAGRRRATIPAHLRMRSATARRPAGLGQSSGSSSLSALLLFVVVPPARDPARVLLRDEALDALGEEAQRVARARVDVGPREVEVLLVLERLGGRAVGDPVLERTGRPGASLRRRRRRRRGCRRRRPARRTRRRPGSPPRRRSRSP